MANKIEVKTAKAVRGCKRCCLQQQAQKVNKFHTSANISAITAKHAVIITTLFHVGKS